MSIIASLQYLTTVSGAQTSGKVFIVLQDAATGQQTNGNGILIDYTIDINTVITNYQVAISGQSYEIYDGLIEDTDTGYFAFFAVTGQGVDPSPAPAPPAGFCDLAITNIIVNTPESAIGANDASITINATSSYGAIEYSIDNGSTWQTNPTYTGLNGGLLQVKARDTNPAGCLVNGAVTIPILTNLITDDPGVNVGGSNVSRWNAAFNPIVFKYQRKDFEITGVTAQNISGVDYAQLAINGDMSIILALVTANNIAGPTKANPIYVYVNAGIYQGVYTVIDATISSITLNTAYVSDETGFMNSNNIKPYYKIVTNIQCIDPITGRAFVMQSFNRPDATGLIKADISSILQSLLKAIDKSDYTLVNYRDIYLSASYRIAYAESYDDGTSTGYTSDFVQLAPTYYVVYAAKQLGERYGGNLAEFVPFKTRPATKWVTDFAMPAFSLGFPFDLSFLYGEDLAGEQVYYKIQTLDINMQPTGASVIDGFLLNEDGSYLLNTDGTRLIISETTLGNVPIVEHVGLNRLLIGFAFSSDVYYFKIGLWYDNASHVPVQVVNDQIVRIDKDCDYNSVYIRWIGLNGSWNYYRFIYNQEVTLDVQNSTVITRSVEDWEFDETIEDVITKAASEKVQVHAEDMSIEDIKGCQSMKYSPKVQILVSKSPIKWQTIVLNTATFAEYETNFGTYQFAVTFNMPSKNIQSQ